MAACRSLLYVPGNRTDLLAKLDRFPADGYIVDLEDGVPPDEKEKAREIVLAEVPRHIGAGRTMHLRVNPVHSHWHRGDLETAFGCGITRIHVPKVSDPDDLRGVDRKLLELAARWGIGIDTIELFPTIETSRAVLDADKIAAASARITGLVLGGDDLTAEWGARRTPQGDELDYVRQHLVVVANANGALPIDATYPFHQDPEGCARDADRARGMGFRGKQAIHPAQCEVFNRAFSPTREDLAHASAIIAAAEAARAMGRGTASAVGTQIDAAVEKNARRVLELAD